MISIHAETDAEAADRLAKMTQVAPDPLSDCIDALATFDRRRAALDAEVDTALLWLMLACMIGLVAILAVVR